MALRHGGAALGLLAVTVLVNPTPAHAVVATISGSQSCAVGEVFYMSGTTNVSEKVSYYTGGTLRYVESSASRDHYWKSSVRSGTWKVTGTDLAWFQTYCMPAKATFAPQ